MKFMIITLFALIFATLVLSGCIASCPDLKGVELKNLGDVYFVTVDNIKLDGLQVMGKTTILGGTLCNKGTLEGENVNNIYCDIILSNTEIDSQGNIISKDKKNAQIVFDANKTYLETSCLGN